ncbi:MAG: hypothetical protein AABY93_04345 [Bacteroidota bacterium]
MAEKVREFTDSVSNVEVPLLLHGFSFIISVGGLAEHIARIQRLDI